MNKKEMLLRQMDDIMDCFDFSRVHRAMVALDWEWYGDGAPDEWQIRRRARNLMRNAIERNLSNYASYGFCVRIDEDEDGGCLSLSFVVEEWCGTDNMEGE
jgi:hypothetical protein